MGDWTAQRDDKGINRERTETGGHSQSVEETSAHYPELVSAGSRQCNIRTKYKMGTLSLFQIHGLDFDPRCESDRQSCLDHIYNPSLLELSNSQ